MDEAGMEAPERKPRSWLYAVFAVGALVLLLLFYLSPVVCMMGVFTIPFLLLDGMDSSEGEWWVADGMVSNETAGRWFVSTDNEQIRLQVMMVPGNSSANATWRCTIKAYDAWTGEMVANETFNTTKAGTVELPGADGTQARSFLVEYRFEGVASYSIVFEEKLDYYMTD